jgi:hypothetical protein
VQYLQILSSLFNTTVTAEYFTFLAAIILLHKKKAGIWQLFIPMLFVIIFAETMGWFLHKHLHKPNAWVFNINMLLTDVFFLWIISKAEPLLKSKRIIYAAIILFSTPWIIGFTFFNGALVYLQYIEALGDILLVIACCYFFYAAITEEIYRNLLVYEYFWIVNGILFSALGSAILYLFPEVMGSYQKHTLSNIFSILNTILNLLLYSSLIIAFICRNRNTN